MVNPMSMEGRLILVTGASSGIGRETSVLLSQLGARLVLVGRNEERLQQTFGLLQGTRHKVEPLDLASTEAISPWLKNLSEELGPLDGLVHSAGVQFVCPLAFMKMKRLEELMQVNFNAAVALVRAFRQKGCFHPNSSVVFLASVMGLVGQPGVSAYAASKGALIALTKSLALELAGESIRINSVAPAVVETRMAAHLKEQQTSGQFEDVISRHPLGIGKPIDVAYGIAYLLADTGRWITGTTLVIDGGYTAQ
ncbi:MAG: SDR family NAD(P)-dependent oxidoreductase [Syntrophobacteraceae bacterium]